MEVIADNFLSQETGPYSQQDIEALQESEIAEQRQAQEELIGGKFKSPDDLLKAYQELERKLGNRSEVQEQDVSDDDVEGQDQEPVVLSQEEESTIMESIGGQESFESVQAWARENLDGAELEAYNREVNSGDYYRARNALQSLYFAFKENAGYEPDLIGGKLSANSSDVFRSSQEVMAAMNDPRYLQDSAYTQDVQDKLLRSDVLGPRG
jgi:hypothetical protein